MNIYRLPVLSDNYIFVLHDPQKNIAAVVDPAESKAVLAKLEELNFLNETDFYLDNSDHDLMARAFLEKQYMCGYVPIEFNSPLKDGSTRSSLYMDTAEYKINKQERERLSKICNSSLEKYRGGWEDRDPVCFSLNFS
jgi:hypothetical protein